MKEEKSMKLARWKTLAGSLFLAAVLSVPAWGADTDNRHNAVPGTLNYVEGQASIDNQTLDSKSVGDAELQNGQILETGNGKAEILLTPGVYLRIGDNSSVKMVSANLTNTNLHWIGDRPCWKWTKFIRRTTFKSASLVPTREW